MPGDSTRNVVHGDTGPVVQARDIHLHRAPTPPTPHQLPPDVSHFTGRAVELDILDALLAGVTRPVVISAIAGAGGVGKTSLAVHWAHRVRDRFPDGQLYVNLRGFSPEPQLQPSQVLTGFLSALGVPGAAVPRDIDAMTGLYRSLLADRRVLVLLDNAATAEQVRPLLPGSPTCLVLATSRNRLAGLAAREGARRITLGELPPPDALALARDVIGPARADAEPDATNDLVQRCAGLPLALRIAAEQVADRPHRNIADLASDLANRRLDALTTEDDPNATVRSVFTWSYRALPAVPARMFRLLGLHPGPTISTHAAGVLAGITSGEARPLLDRLTNGHLLVEIGHDRFRFHDLVREFAAETARTCDSEETRGDSVRRLLSWYLHTADVARLIVYPHHGLPRVDHQQSDVEPLQFDSRSDALEWHKQEQLNLSSVLLYASQHGHHRTAALLPSCLATYYVRLGDWAADVDACTIGVESARQLGDEQVELVSLSALADALLRDRRLHESMHFSEQMMQIATRIGHRRQVAGAHHTHGLALQQLGLDDEAVGRFRDALQLYRELDVHRGEAIMLGALGEIYRRQRRYDDASSHLKQSLEIFRTTGNTWNEALYLRRMAQLQIDLGDHHTAIEHLERSVVLYAELEDLYETSRTLMMLSETLSRQGDHDRATWAMREAVTIYRNVTPSGPSRVP